MWNLSNLKNNQGFTLIESILAVGILSVIAVQIINIQSTHIAINQTSINTIKATWALRQTTSQVEYIIETYGASGLKGDVETVWPSEAKDDEKMTIKIQSKDSIIEPAKLLNTMKKMGGLGKEKKDDKEAEEGKQEDDAMLKTLAETAQIPKDMFRSVNIIISWKEGSATRSIEGGFLLMDDKKLLDLGSGLPSIPGMPDLK